jgi:hypothetical protein
MIQNDYQGSIHYVIPKSLITNDSKFYKQFKLFLKKYFKIVSVFDVDPAKFDNVAQGLIVLSMTRGGNSTNYMTKHNGVEEPVDSVIQLDSPDIPFQQIFKKTYLGSVPAESFLMSSPEETADEFRARLVKIFSNPVSIKSLRDDLKHNGKYHLKILSSKDTVKVDAKLDQILAYINEVKTVVKDYVKLFNDPENYVPIQQRKETRFYFRNTALRKCSFVYELNPNPQPSFYFTSNPSDGSTDYFGYCEYDISRNSSPGCCRTVPIENIEDNLTDDFKKYWDTNTNKLPYEFVFDYIKYISDSKWYKEQKKLRRRFYFCLPNTFNTAWMKDFDQAKQKLEQKELAKFLVLKRPQVEKEEETQMPTTIFDTMFEPV